MYILYASHRTSVATIDGVRRCEATHREGFDRNNSERRKKTPDRSSP